MTGSNFNLRAEGIKAVLKISKQENKSYIGQLSGQKNWKHIIWKIARFNVKLNPK